MYKGMAPTNIFTYAAPNPGPCMTWGMLPSNMAPSTLINCQTMVSPSPIQTSPLSLQGGTLIDCNAPITSPIQCHNPMPAISPTLGANYPMSITMQMEVVWHGEFNRLFQNFMHTWELIPTMTPPTGESISFKVFQDSAKVRFSCDDCGRGWTSMKGRVAFWFSLDQEQLGRVLFKLYGQQCQRCKEQDKPEKWHHAMWYPEEVMKVIQNLYNRVGTIYYGFQLPPIRIDRRTGKPRAQHDAKLCQACSDGLCKEGWTLN